MQRNEISVLMSLYKKENPAFLVACLDSVLAQTLLPKEIVIVIDGPITSKLQQVLDEYQSRSGLLRLLPQKENKGLGYTLAIGVEACQYELVARMDTDDLMLPTRLEEQVNCFNQNTDLSICGTNIEEFIEDSSNIISRRLVPESNQAIRQFSKKRNPFNHMTVMFRRSDILKVGNYQPMQGFEDYYLWARLLKAGYKAYNIQDFLVKARVGKDMYKRRGGWQYLINGVRGRIAVYHAGLGNFFDFIVTTGVHIVVSLMPNRIRARFYQEALH